MSTEKKYYVYVHRYASGPKEGQVFYVGKGSGRRAWRRHGRSAFWKRIVEKYGHKTELVGSFSGEVCAFYIEIAIIRLIGKQNLCNITDGGEGASGTKRTKEHIEKLRASVKGIPKSDETKAKLRLASLLSRSDPDVIDRISHGTKKAMENPDIRRKISENHADVSGMNNPNIKRTIYTFSHKKIGVYVGTQYEFYTEYGLNGNGVRLLTGGKKPSHKGWTILNG